MALRLATVIGVAGLLMLNSCAAPPAPPTLSAPLTANPTTATVAAVRGMNIEPGDGASLGVNAVLSGLAQPPLRQPASGSEVVIVKQDGNAGSIVTPAAGLIPGAHVAVISAAATSLVLQN